MTTPRYIAWTIALLALTSCEPKPKACIEMPDTIEAGATLYMETCSEDYDFLTWEFSDGRGYMTESVERKFEEEMDMTLTLTAYSDGAYRSDEVVHAFKTSYRYVDRMEVVGTSNFNAFELRMSAGTWRQSGANGVFTEEAPFIIYVWPEEKAVIETEISSRVQVFGIRNGNESELVEKRYNFSSFRDNPIVLTTDNLTFKVYWTYRD